MISGVAISPVNFPTYSGFKIKTSDAIPKAITTKQTKDEANLWTFITQYGFSKFIQLISSGAGAGTTLTCWLLIEDLEQQVQSL